MKAASVRRFAAAVAVAAIAMGLCAPVAPAQPVDAGDGSMVLTFQSPWVGPAADFLMRLRVQRPSGPSNLEVATTVYPAVATRSEFTETLRDRATAAPLLPTQVFPLTSLTPDDAGDLTVTVRLQDRMPLGRDDGVFPVRVDLRERGTGEVLHRFTTHVVHVTAQSTAPKLGLSLVIPLHAPPGLPPAGPRQLRSVDDLAAATGALDAVRNAPIALAPTPETLTTLAASSDDERAAGLVKSLQQKTAGMTVLAGAYVPASLPGLLAAGLEKDAFTQVALGASAVSEVLRVRPDSRTWVAAGPLDRASVALLGNARGIDRLVAEEATFEPIARQNVTLTQPFQVRDATRQVQAVAADGGLAAHFDNRPSPVLAASRLLADLAVVYFDQPGADRRAVTAVAPRSWRPDRPFLDTLLAGLAENPLVEAVSLDSMFSSVVPARGPDGRPLVRQLATPGARGGLAEVASELRTARRRLDSLGSVLGERTPAQSEIEERLLVAQSDEWRTARQRQPYLEGVLKGITAQAGEIRMPEGRSITLTDRKGEIPVTFQNRTGVPAKVVVRVESDKLDFPRGRVQTLDLTRRNTTERFAVVSRTSGAFPLRITLESPDGNLELGRALLTVRSTVASRMSLIVSLGAALFLAVWWGRHALRGRRARRLVPAEQGGGDVDAMRK